MCVIFILLLNKTRVVLIPSHSPPIPSHSPSLHAALMIEEPDLFNVIAPRILEASYQLALEVAKVTMQESSRVLVPTMDFMVSRITATGNARNGGSVGGPTMTATMRFKNAAKRASKHSFGNKATQETNAKTHGNNAYKQPINAYKRPN